MDRETERMMLESCKIQEERNGKRWPTYRCWCGVLLPTYSVGFDLVIHWDMCGGWKKHLADYCYGGTNGKGEGT